MLSKLFGRFSFLGLVVAVLSIAIDQAQKYYSLFVYDIANSGPVDWTPNLQFVLVWNRGVSYGLFQQHESAGRWALVDLEGDGIKDGYVFAKFIVPVIS